MGFGLRSRLLSSLLLAGLAALALPAAASAATVFVDDSSPNPLPVCGTTAALACQTIQFGVDAANPLGGDVIQVAAGTYGEQVDVDKAVTIAGAGQATTKILSPASLTTTFGSSKPVVYVHAGPTTIQNLTVDGGGVGNANAGLVGIAYHNAGGIVQLTSIINVRDNPIGTDADGVGLYGFNADAMARTLIVSSNVVNQFQKAGMVLEGAGLTVDVAGNIVTGAGPTAQVSQNGIQLTTGAGGAVRVNSISALDFTPLTDCAAGVFFLAPAAGATISNNEVNGVECGLGSTLGTATTISANTVNGSRIGISRFDGAGTIANNRVTGGPQPDSLGIYVIESALNANFSVTATGNTLIGHNDRGIRLEDFDPDAFKPSIVASFNRIVANPGDGAENSGGGSFAAENNWWGCNAGPSQPGCDGILGAIDADPWLVLGAGAAPATVATGESSLITASLRTNSDGVNVGPGFPAGTVVSFSAALGSVQPPSAATSGGLASTNFVAGAVPGAGSATASLDNQSVTVPIAVTALGQIPGSLQGACANRKSGAQGPDTLIGTARGDRLQAKGGDDTLKGRAGEDCLNGGAGEDTVNGGAAADRIKGGSGDDVLQARDGEVDRVRCGGGEDTAKVDSDDDVKGCETVRRSLVSTIHGGTSEIQRNIIAKTLGL